MVVSVERWLPLRGPSGNWKRSILHIGSWIIILFFSLISWITLSELYPILIPTPIEVLNYLLKLKTRTLVNALTRTLFNSFMGFTIALILSLALGFLGYISPILYTILEKLNKLIQSISVLVWAIIAIMIFGVTSPIPPVIVTTAASFPVILSSTVSGVRDVDSQYYELSKLLEASKFQTFRHIILPGTIPYIMAASRSALGLAIRISVVAEAFGAAGGLGYQLIYSYDLGIKEGVFAWAILLIVLMVVLDGLVLGPIERWSKKWMQSS